MMMNRAVLQTALAAQRRQIRPVVYRLADAPRFFGKNKKQGGGKPLTLKMCYGPYDLEEEPEDYNSVKFNKPPTSMKDIQSKLEEMADPDELEEGLEFYSNGEWKKLTDPSQLKGQNIPIRVPSMYEEVDESMVDDYGEDDDLDYDGGDDLDYDGGELSSTIRELVKTLKSEGYTRSTDQLELKSKDGGQISTKEWVLNQANGNGFFQGMLLSKVGGLDHIVQCLHFDFLWEQQKPEDGSAHDDPKSKSS